MAMLPLEPVVDARGNSPPESCRDWVESRLGFREDLDSGGDTDNIDNIDTHPLNNTSLPLLGDNTSDIKMTGSVLKPLRCLTSSKSKSTKLKPLPTFDESQSHATILAAVPTTGILIKYFSKLFVYLPCILYFQ